MPDISGLKILVFLLPSKVPARPQHRGVLITDKHPCTSPVLGADQEEVGEGGVYCHEKPDNSMPANYYSVKYYICIKSGKFKNYKERINLPLANTVNTI